MVKCWWFAFCCPSECIRECCSLHAAAIVCSVQLQSAMNAYTAFQFQWHSGKYFQASEVSTQWTLSFSCSRLHAMSVLLRREMGSIHRLTAGWSINRCWTRKQLENMIVTPAALDLSHRLWTLTANGLFCMHLCSTSHHEGLDLRFSGYNCVLESRSSLQRSTNEMPPPHLYAELIRMYSPNIGFGNDLEIE